MLKTVVQDSLDLGMYNELYDILIEKDNFQRLLNKKVNFSFITEEIKKNYSDDMGRSSEDPVRMFK